MLPLIEDAAQCNLTVDVPFERDIINLDVLLILAELEVSQASGATQQFGDEA